MVAKTGHGEWPASPSFIAKAGELLDAKGVLRAAAPHLEWTRLPAWFGEYAKREQEAVSVWTYDTPVVLGLVQTEDYARTALSAYVPALDEEEIERRVQARMERQVLLARKPPVSPAMVVGEWALRRPAGGEAVLGVRSERLLELSGLRNASVQITPTHYEAHAGFDGPFTLPGTSERQWAVYLETRGTSDILGGRNRVSEFRTRHGMLRAQDLTPKDSAQLIEEMIREL